MNTPQENLEVIENFILHLTHCSRVDLECKVIQSYTPEQLYMIADEYISEDHVDGKGRIAVKSENWKVNTPEEGELDISLTVNDNVEYGSFELYDTETGGELCYAEGGIWFTGKKVTDYDGVYELSNHIITKLNEWGYDTSEL